MSRALQNTPPDVALAKQAIDYWNQSLQIKPDQDVIEKLVNKYTPPQ